MSMAIAGSNGQCPCIPCQLHLTRSPARRALIKRAKLRGDFELARSLGSRYAR